MTAWLDRNALERATDFLSLRLRVVMRHVPRPMPKHVRDGPLQHLHFGEGEASALPSPPIRAYFSFAPSVGLRSHATIMPVVLSLSESTDRQVVWPRPELE